MKKLIIVLAMLLFCTQAYAADFAVWVWGDEATSVRLGYLIDPNTEVGMSASWWNDETEPQVIGLFGIRYLPEVLQIPNPIVLDWLPETLKGRPYLGARIERSLRVDTTIFSPLAGIDIDPFFIEHRFNTFGSMSTTVIGVRFKF